MKKLLGFFAIMLPLIFAGCWNMYGDALDDIGKSQWARSVVSASDGTLFYSVAADNNGNSYAIGYVIGKGFFDFGGSNGLFTNTNASIYNNTIIVKYNSSGTVQWATPIKYASDSCQFRGVAVDISGNSYAAGCVWGTGVFDFGGNSVPINDPNSGGWNAVIVKYDPSGKAVWATKITTAPNDSEFCSISVDSSGNSYAVGYVYGTGSFSFGGINGSVNGSFSSGNNAVIVKYNSAGSAQWARSVTVGPGWSQYLGVSVDGNGNVYAAGEIYGSSTYYFGPTSTVPATGSGYSSGINAVLVKYNSTGTVLWAQTVASVTNVSAFNSVCTDKNGYIYAAGYTSYGTYSFGTLSSAQFNNTSSSTSNSVIVKYDPSSGNALWAQTVIPSAASGTSLYNSVNVDTSGNAYTAGYISGNNHGFGNGVNAFGIYNGNNAVLAKYNTSGNALWARTLTAAPDQSQFYGVNVDSSGNIYSVGSINGTGSFTFDTLFNPLTVAGSRGGVGNAVIVKYLQ